MRNFSTISLVVISGLVGLSVSACSGRRVHSDESTDDKDKRVENLTSALSRAQTRIEELDAKVSALTDKLDSTRLIVDNVSGNKPIKTEVVGHASPNKTDAFIDRVGEITDGASKSAHATLTDTNKDRKYADPAITVFSKAMTIFKSGKYTESELAFNHFTEQYPEHVLAGSAQFFAGESYFMLGEYKLAVNEYNKVLSSFPSSPRVASALVRLGHCYAATGNPTESAKVLAVARDVYMGNPSLDWPAPSGVSSATKKTQASKSELPSGPIEPASDAHSGNAGHHADDSEIDDIESSK